MNNTYRERLVIHGSILLMAGLLCGYFSVAAMAVIPGPEAYDAWTRAQVGLSVVGIWLLATAGIFNLLVLEKRETLALVRSFIAAAYGLLVALPLEAVIGHRAVSPSHSPIEWVAFIANLIALAGMALGALLTVSGARAALKPSQSGEKPIQASQSAV
jgi:hypothetical protein